MRQAWQITRGKGVTVALVATGVDARTAGLTGKVITGPSYGNVAHTSSVLGTLLASAIAGRWPGAPDPFGAFGLAPAARILSIKMPSSQPFGAWQKDEAKAIHYAVGHGAQVIYLGSVGYEDLAVLDSAVAYAESKNAVVIGTELRFGHHSPSDLQFPTGLPGVLGAAPVRFAGLPPPLRPWPATADASILVSAPGNVRNETGPLGPGYGMYNQADATAWLAATVALIKSAHPALPPALVELAIARSARARPPGGYRARSGFGLINPGGALHEAALLSRLRPAAAGQAAQNPAARLAPGPPPGIIYAVRHSTVRLEALTGAAAAGFVLLGLALFLALRRPAG